jgi:hypothetical protein
LPIGWHILQLVYSLSIQSYAINPHWTSLVNTISHRPPWSNDPPVIPWRHGLWTESIDGASLALESVDNVHSLVGWSLCIVVCWFSLRYVGEQLFASYVVLSHLIPKTIPSGNLAKLLNMASYSWFTH